MTQQRVRVSRPDVVANENVSPILSDIEKIARLREEIKEASRKLIWKYEPANQSDFQHLMQAFVTCLDGNQAEAGRKLLVPPTTMGRWLNGTQMPRIFLRASFRARMIEVLNNDNS